HSDITTFSSLRRRHHLTSPLFPYTTLFRSDERVSVARHGFVQHVVELAKLVAAKSDTRGVFPLHPEPWSAEVLAQPLHGFERGRSEEHTSELQSLRHLVCRLLLEKKKHINT